MSDANGTVEEPADRILRQKNKQNASTQEKINVLNDATANRQANNLSIEDVGKIERTVITLQNLLTVQTLGKAG